MPLTQDRNTPEKEGKFITPPVAAATKIFAGALVATNAAGNAVPGSVSTTLKAAGRAEKLADNSAGAAGDITVKVAKGTFRFKNSTAGDLITNADRENDCYIVDDETVAKTNGTNTRSVAGKVDSVDAAGVWVRFA